MPRVSSLVVWLTSDSEKGLRGSWRNKKSTTAWYGFPVSVLGPIVPHRSTRQTVSRTPSFPRHDPVRLFAQGAPGLSHPVCNERSWTPRECPAFGTRVRLGIIWEGKKWDNQESNLGPLGAVRAESTTRSTDHYTIIPVIFDGTLCGYCFL